MNVKIKGKMGYIYSTTWPERDCTKSIYVVHLGTGGLCHDCQAVSTETYPLPLTIEWRLELRGSMTHNSGFALTGLPPLKWLTSITLLSLLMSHYWGNCAYSNFFFQVFEIVCVTLVIMVKICTRIKAGWSLGEGLSADQFWHTKTGKLYTIVYQNLFSVALMHP